MKILLWIKKRILKSEYNEINNLRERVLDLELEVSTLVGDLRKLSYKVDQKAEEDSLLDLRLKVYDHLEGAD